MKVVHFDCFSGASGDMVVGALIDAGVPFDDIRRSLGSLSVDDAVWVERVSRAGVSATKFCVRGEDTPASDPHVHSHDRVDGHGHRHEHSHRTLDEIYSLLDRSCLGVAGKARAKALFERLGNVEAVIHGSAPNQVHLHEVGALDSIVDIVSAVCALDVLGADRITASSLNVGSGSARSAHGLYPVPAPATLRLLEGVPIYAGPQQAEMVTPTGALLITDYAQAYGPLPPMRVTAVGYGAGSRDFRDTPNVLRVLVGEADGAVAGDTPSHAVVVMEAEIDDMNPQIFGVVMDRLLAEGAFDVFYTPVYMKKNRPGTLMTIVASPGARERLTATIFKETTTIGVRYREMMRECLDRAVDTVGTPFGPVRVKVARRDGEILNVAPEFDDCVRLAGQHGRAVKDVQAVAMKAWLDTDHP